MKQLPVVIPGVRKSSLPKEVLDFLTTRNPGQTTHFEEMYWNKGVSLRDKLLVLGSRSFDAFAFLGFQPRTLQAQKSGMTM